MTYSRVLYYFGNTFPNLISACIIPFILFVIGLYLYVYHLRLKESETSMFRSAKSGPPISRKGGMIFAAIFSSFSFLILVLLISYTLIVYFSIKEIYENKEYQIIEGTVKKFKPGSGELRTFESFVVNNTEFKYDDASVINFGYNTVSAHGGVIKEGLMIRISYLEFESEKVILKIEI